MEMKGFFVLIFGSLLLTCSTKTERQKAVGKYINDYELRAEHYVLLMKNDSFRHVYNGSLGQFVNTGRWGVDEDGRSITFRDWQSFGKYADDNCSIGCASSVNFDGDELYFSHDEPKEMNFYRERGQ